MAYCVAACCRAFVAALEIARRIRMTTQHFQRRTTPRAIVIERFERKERARPDRRFVPLSTIAKLYAKESHCTLDDAYRELIKALDTVGFLGTRVLFLHPDISPPYIRPRDTNPTPSAPPPAHLPHKKAPLITRSFIEDRIREMDFGTVRDGYLARCWIAVVSATRWLNSHGITAPGLSLNLAPTVKRSKAGSAKGARAHKRNRAKAVMIEIGVQSLKGLSVKELTDRVVKYLKSKGLPEVNRDTVRRAAREVGLL
jgi:hypothetical protein